MTRSTYAAFQLALFCRQISRPILASLIVVRSHQSSKRNPHKDEREKIACKVLCNCIRFLLVRLSKFGGSNTLKISHAGSIVDLVSNLKIFAKKEIQLRQNNTACKINTREPETLRPPVPCFLKHNKEKRIP